jgi:predicted RNA-binding Zn ribbon-like protein
MTTKYNEDALKHLAEIWAKFFRTKKGKALIKQADEAEEFLRKLGETLADE